MTVEKEFKHSPFKMFTIIFVVLLFIVILGFNYLTMSSGIDIGVFINSTGDVSDYFHLEITPANWTFTIWAFIYVWQAIWIIYILTTLCRKTETGYLYLHNSQMPMVCYWIYVFTSLLNIAWTFLFDRFMIEWSLLVIVFFPITLITTIILVVRALNVGQHSLASQGMLKEVWFNRIFLQNGLGIYAAWTTVATCLNLGMVLTYKIQIDEELACTVVLAILSLLLVVWIITDLIVCDKYTRFLFIPYVVIVVALAGSMHQNWDPTKRNSIFTAVIMGVNGAALVIKIVTMIYRQCKNPIPSTRKEKSVAYQPDPESQSVSDKTPVVEQYTGNL